MTKLENVKNWQISKQKKSEILWYQIQKTIISGLKLQLRINVKSVERRSGRFFADIKLEVVQIKKKSREKVN